MIIMISCKNYRFPSILLLFVALTSGRSISKTNVDNSFRLLLLHTNDMHSRFDQTDRYSSTCSDVSKRNGQCYGGFARLKQAVREARKEAELKGIPSIFLNAGDTFQGTMFYSMFKWKVVADLINAMDIDVMALGNHEFDDGIAGLTPFLKAITIPNVASNLNLENATELNLPILTKSIVLHVSGKKIGVVGYLTPETMQMSTTDGLIIENEIPHIRKEARKLKNEGIDIIIALGHSGYEMDLKIATEVLEVSVVVGGHTNTFLYTPKDSPPDVEQPIDYYPRIVTQSNGRKVPVVQVYAFTKYLGKLWLTFDDNGDVIEADGNPLLLDSSIQQDVDVLKKVDRWLVNVQTDVDRELGKSKVFLEGRSVLCGLRECNLGNFIADAYIDAAASKYENVNSSWIDAPIAFIQNGCIRTDLGADVITYGDVLVVIPFQNDLKRVRLTGSTIRKALEHSVRRYTDPPLGGEFLQVSGLRVQYDLSKEPNQRVVSVSVRCGNCSVPSYKPLRDDEIYIVLMSQYLKNAGDGYTMFRDESLSSESVGLSDTTAMMNYIEKLRFIYPGIENRIEITNKRSLPTPSVPSVADRSFGHRITSINLFLLISSTIVTFVISLESCFQ